MKKTLLALAITAFSANAFAVNLDTPATPATQVFASEIDLTAPVTLGATNPLTTSGAAGFTLTNSYIRYDLSGTATFGSVPALTGAAGTIASGGTVDSNFVVFNVAASLPAATVVTMNAQVKVADQSSVNVTYGLYQQASDAVNKTNSLSSKS